MLNEQINALLVQLAKQQAEINEKESLLKELEKENKKLRTNAPQKTFNSSIYSVTRKSGKVVYGFTIRDENYKKIRREGFSTKGEAEAERRNLLNLRDKKQLSVFIENQKQTFNEFSEAYMKKARAEFAYNTIASAEGIIKNHLSYFKDIQITKLSVKIAREWNYEYRNKIGPSAFNNSLKLAKAIWNNAIEIQLTDLPNPFNKITPINIKKECNTRERVRIGNAEAELLIETAFQMFPEDDDYTPYVIATGYYAGIREGEIFGLKWSDFDFTANTVHIQRQVQKITKKRIEEILATNPELSERDIIITERLKTEASEDIIVIPNKLAEYLLAYKKKLMSNGRLQELCFCKPDGSPVVCRDFVRYKFQKVLKVVFNDEKFMHFHELRGSCATTLHKNGVPTKIIQELLRHTKTSTTEDIYVHVKKTSKEVADRINAVFSA